MTVFHALRQAKVMSAKIAALAGTTKLRISTTKSIDTQTRLLYLREMGVVLLLTIIFGVAWWIQYKER
jgi:cytochrome bd-type quinol oxidase subunit 2